MPTKLHEPKIGLTGSLAQNATATVQPPSGEEWVITSLGTSLSTGAPLVTLIEMYDGTNPVMLRKGELAGNPLFVQWQKPMRFGLTNGIYLRLTNLNASNATLLYSGAVTGIGTAGVGDIKSGITASVAAGSYVTVQPGAGEGWVLLEAGIESAGWGTNGGWVGVAEPYPKITVRLYDGSTEIYAQRGDDWSIFNPLRVVFTNSVYARIYNEDASARNIGYIAQRVY